MSTKKQNCQRPKQRFNRGLWLKTALEFLATEGNSKLRVDQIAKALGVTKGSFYAHFKSREDFLLSVANYWSEEFNHRVKRTLVESGGSARDQLQGVMELVCGENLSRYDVALSSWSAQEPIILPIVKQAFQLRIDYIRSLMREMGFRGLQLKVRVETFVGFMMFRGSFSPSAAKIPSKQTLRTWIEFFTRT